MTAFTFATQRLPATAEVLRQEVRDFLAEEQAAGRFQPVCDAWLGSFDPDFSQRLGARGYIGMTWPKTYGGHGRSALERYVVLEELLAAGAPVAAHWIADRQMGPLILRHGSEAQKQRYLPEMARGSAYWAIGMSEPGAGSDLSAVRSKLEPDGDGWRLTGQKIWSSGAHDCHYMMALVRSGPPGDSRHEGLTNVIVDLRAPGVTIRPIRLLDGGHHFNEVFFDDVFIPADQVVGEVGDGWRQVTEELAYERSGPERFLTTFPLLRAVVERARTLADPYLHREVALLVSELAALRELSISIAGMLERGANPVVEAALVKDAGTQFERKVTEIAERMACQMPSTASADGFSVWLAQSIYHGPGFTLRGGTNEILRGIVARGLGLR
ncbi:MAG: acyl-CoA dehydrogenase family protein [Alicyclobacillus sp.]|nr:acyl-CoA dehydrogenase family protein [Alicyclobacillus sp.]